MQLDKTNQAEVLALMPELKPGILWGFVVNGQAEQRCPGGACYVLHIQNWPNGILANLREKLNYRHDWFFQATYWMGQRFLNFGAHVEIRGGLVSQYAYSLAVETEDFPANPVRLQVLGTDRASFPGFFGFIDNYDEIGGLGTRIPANEQTTTLYVAFTSAAPPEHVRNAFETKLNCIWNTQGCSTTKQLLPVLWARKVGTKKQR